MYFISFCKTHFEKHVSKYAAQQIKKLSQQVLKQKGKVDANNSPKKRVDDIVTLQNWFEK